MSGKVHIPDKIGKALAEYSLEILSASALPDIACDLLERLDAPSLRILAGEPSDGCLDPKDAHRLLSRVYEELGLSPPSRVEAISQIALYWINKCIDGEVGKVKVVEELANLAMLPDTPAWLKPFITLSSELDDIRQRQLLGTDHPLTKLTEAMLPIADAKSAWGDRATQALNSAFVYCSTLDVELAAYPANRNIFPVVNAAEFRQFLAGSKPATSRDIFDSTDSILTSLQTLAQRLFPRETMNMSAVISDDRGRPGRLYLLKYSEGSESDPSDKLHGRLTLCRSDQVLVSPIGAEESERELTAGQGTVIDPKGRSFLVTLCNSTLHWELVVFVQNVYPSDATVQEIALTGAHLTLQIAASSGAPDLALVYDFALTPTGLLLDLTCLNQGNLEDRNLFRRPITKLDLTVLTTMASDLLKWANNYT